MPSHKGPSHQNELTSKRLVTFGMFLFRHTVFAEDTPGAFATTTNTCEFVDCQDRCLEHTNELGLETNDVCQFGASTNGSDDDVAGKIEGVSYKAGTSCMFDGGKCIDIDRHVPALLLFGF
jgi:hypothetical protein